MNKILDKYFPKKFHVRVKHHTREYYIIQYSYYRFFPFWKNLKTYLYLGFPSHSNGWRNALDEYASQVSLAKSLQSIDDVRAYEARELGYAQKEMKEVEEGFKRKAPVDVQYIK